MKIKDKRSDRIETALNINPVNRKGKGGKIVTSELKESRWNHGVLVNRTGKGNRKDWEREIVMGGMKAASQSLKDFVKGKKDREDPLTELIKRKIK